MNWSWILGATHTRVLTQGECALAQSVFANHLDLTQIHLIAATRMWRGYAMSPNGMVYFHPSDWVDDFSQASIQQQSWLIHELTHVWQYQQGRAVALRAALNRRYTYDAGLSRPFLQYGMEQQAQIVQDYFLRRAQGLECTAYQRCLPFGSS